MNHEGRRKKEEGREGFTNESSNLSGYRRVKMQGFSTSIVNILALVC
jgi:hypothetical protein